MKKSGIILGLSMLLPFCLGRSGSTNLAFQEGDIVQFNDRSQNLINEVLTTWYVDPDMEEFVTKAVRENRTFTVEKVDGDKIEIDNGKPFPANIFSIVLSASRSQNPFDQMHRRTRQKKQSMDPPLKRGISPKLHSQYSKVIDDLSGFTPVTWKGDRTKKRGYKPP